MARRRASRFSAIPDLPRAGGLCRHGAQIDLGKARATELGRRRSDPPTRQKWRQRRIRRPGAAAAAAADPPTRDASEPGLIGRPVSARRRWRSRRLRFAQAGHRDAGELAPELPFGADGDGARALGARAAALAARKESELHIDSARVRWLASAAARPSSSGALAQCLTLPTGYRLMHTLAAIPPQSPFNHSRTTTLRWQCAQSLPLARSYGLTGTRSTGTGPGPRRRPVPTEWARRTPRQRHILRRAGRHVSVCRLSGPGT